MRGVQAVSGALAIVVSVWLFRIVLHSYTDHNHVDVFHLVVALGAAVAGLFLLWRAVAGRKGIERASLSQR